ncbi:hypothetical protein B0H17DRAFT_1145783 [Mycena rosella]|uniref:F-box domain-containing protein n=1 Tax=Mycena rosella TaxID=1033263 RepID=A0AAD7CQ99_MYCRO|nr:hypothetical protein B0H17DRAFT_1145783 [Mycena rosella]
MSTPSAWSRVNVCFPQPPDSDDSELDCVEEEDEDMPRPLGLWLLHARASELCIQIKIVVPRVDYIFQAIKHLGPHFAKTKELELIVEPPSVLTLNQLLEMLPPLRALEHLTLSANFWNHTIRMFGFNPEDFTSLTLTKCILGPMPTAKNSGTHPHLTIRELTLNNIQKFTLDQVLETIEPFLCLESLTFTICIAASLSKHSTRSITLPTLTTFTVGHNPNILANLTLPKLETLILDQELPVGDQTDAGNLLSDLFGRGRNLRHLTLSFTPTRQILQHLPGLIVLELVDCAVKMQRLIRGTTSPTPCVSPADPPTPILQLGRWRVAPECKTILARDIEEIRKAGGLALDIDVED